MNVSDYLYLINERVFMWATLDRLDRHFNRYRNEHPSIMRFQTGDILKLNPHVEFCKINSGATRPNFHLGGVAPRRGHETFQSVAQYSGNYSSVAEVTFPGKCKLPRVCCISKKPTGPWQELLV